MRKGEFKKLLDHGEDTWLDWKRDFPAGLLKEKKDTDWDKGKGTLLKDLVSIANGDDERPGFLVYGVKDHGPRREVIGISKSWDGADFQTWAENSFEPPPSFSYFEFTWTKTKTVGIFRIERSSEYPHVASQTIGKIIFEGQVWFRRGSKNTVAHYKELKRMFSENKPFKIGRLNDPVIDQIKAHYTGKGLELVFPKINEKDSRLARGYKLAFYPHTRRQVWVGDELIVMIKPT